MPYNGSGTFISLPPPDFPALPFTTILASMFNANMNDVFVNGLTNCLTRDGQSPPTANLPMAGFKLTNLGTGTSDSDSAQLGQTLAVRGQVGTVDWDTRVTNGIFEATAASLATPSVNFPPTSDLGQLVVAAQGALVTQTYVAAAITFQRQKVGGSWTVWTLGDSNKNYIVNSGCQIWQAGTFVSGVAGKNYVMDQCFDNSGGTTYSSSQQTFTLGQTDVDPQARFYKRVVVVSSAGASNFCASTYPMESVRTLAGKVVTVSLYAKANAGQSIALEFSQVFGTGGSPSAEVSTFVAKTVLTSSWVRYSFSVTLPNIAGKTLGSSDNDYLALNIWMDAGSTFNSRTGTLGQQSGTFDFFGLKVEQGSRASAYIFPDLDKELLACQRFFVNTGTAVTLYSGPTTSGSPYYCHYDFPVTMRGIPVVTPIDITQFAFTLGTTTDLVSFTFLRFAKDSNSTQASGSYVMGATLDARF